MKSACASLNVQVMSNCAVSVACLLFSFSFM